MAPIYRRDRGFCFVVMIIGFGTDIAYKEKRKRAIRPKRFNKGMQKEEMSQKSNTLRSAGLTNNIFVVFHLMAGQIAAFERVRNWPLKVG